MLQQSFNCAALSEHRPKLFQFAKYIVHSMDILSCVHVTPCDALSCYAVWACLPALICTLQHACHWLWILPPDASLWLAPRVLQRHPWGVALPAGWSAPLGMRLPSGAWDTSIARSCLSVVCLHACASLRYRIILLRECSACPNSDRFPHISYCMRAGKRAIGTYVIAGAPPYKKKKKKNCGTTARVAFNGWHTDAFPVDSGVFQGSPLSPLLSCSRRSRWQHMPGSSRSSRSSNPSGFLPDSQHQSCTSMPMTRQCPRGAPATPR